MRVYVNNFNLLTWPRAMAEVLLEQDHAVTIVDNASTYVPLLQWYASKPTGVRVVRLVRNYGHTAPWAAQVVEYDGQPYAVTDPDLDISAIPEDWPDILTEGMQYGGKCGFSLDDSRVPRANPAAALDEFEVGKGNKRWWPKRVGTGYHHVPVDTTFAVYPAKKAYFIGGCRAGRPYTAVHLPWHIVLHPDPNDPGFQLPITEELANYWETSNGSSTTAHRHAAMLAAYRGKHGVQKSE